MPPLLRPKIRFLGSGALGSGFCLIADWEPNLNVGPRLGKIGQRRPYAYAGRRVHL